MCKFHSEMIVQVHCNRDFMRKIPWQQWDLNPLPSDLKNCLVPTYHYPLIGSCWHRECLIAPSKTTVAVACKLTKSVHVEYSRCAMASLVQPWATRTTWYNYLFKWQFRESWSNSFFHIDPDWLDTTSAGRRRATTLTGSSWAPTTTSQRGAGGPAPPATCLESTSR